MRLRGLFRWFDAVKHWWVSIEKQRTIRIVFKYQTWQMFMDVHKILLIGVKQVVNYGYY